MIAHDDLKSQLERLRKAVDHLGVLTKETMLHGGKWSPKERGDHEAQTRLAYIDLDTYLASLERELDPPAVHDWEEHPSGRKRWCNRCGTVQGGKPGCGWEPPAPEVCEARS